MCVSEYHMFIWCLWRPERTQLQIIVSHVQRLETEQRSPGRAASSCQAFSPAWLFSEAGSLLYLGLRWLASETWDLSAFAFPAQAPVTMPSFFCVIFRNWTPVNMVAGQAPTDWAISPSKNFFYVEKAMYWTANYTSQLVHFVASRPV